MFFFYSILHFSIFALHHSSIPMPNIVRKNVSFHFSGQIEWWWRLIRGPLDDRCSRGLVVPYRARSLVCAINLVASVVATTELTDSDV